MQISYETEALENACTNSRVMRRSYSDACCKGIQRRIKQLQSASQLADLTSSVGKWHSLAGRGPLVYAAHLTANYRLVVQFTTLNGVTSATVLSIEDYH